MSTIKFFHKYSQQILILFKSKSELSSLLAYRMSEINAIDSMRTNLIAFAQFCMPFKCIEIKPFQSQLSRLALLDDFTLNQLCRPAPIDQIGSTRPATFPITCFEPITPNDMSTVHRINSINRLLSVVFNMYLDESCQVVTTAGSEATPIDLRKLIDQVIPNAFQKWLDLANKIQTGRLTFGEIDSFTQVVFNGKTKQFLDEFTYICRENSSSSLSSSVDLRMKQIRLYIKFESSLRAVKLLNGIRAQYGLKGKFDHLDTIEKMHTGNEYKKWTLSCMNKNVENAICVLDSINTPARLACLQAYLDAHELVTWLRLNTRDLKEFKFLVDLILTSKAGSSGNGDEHHVQFSASSKHAFAITLKDACVGYAALIYELNPATDGFDRLLQLCEPLWSVLKNDSNIAKKLIDVKGKFTHIFQTNLLMQTNVRSFWIRS